MYDKRLNIKLLGHDESTEKGTLKNKFMSTIIYTNRNTCS